MAGPGLCPQGLGSLKNIYCFLNIRKLCCLQTVPRLGLVAWEAPYELRRSSGEGFWLQGDRALFFSRESSDDGVLIERNEAWSLRNLYLEGDGVIRKQAC